MDFSGRPASPRCRTCTRRGRVAVAEGGHGAAAQAPDAERGAGRGRGHVGERRVALGELAPRHQRAAGGRVRGLTGAAGRGRSAPQRPAPARGGGLAGRRASRLGRAEVLPFEPAGGRAARGTGGPDQGPLGVRTGAPAAQGGTGARPLRGPLLDRPAPARAHGDARLLLPPVPAAEGTGEKAKPGRRGRRRGRACPRSAGGCSRPSTSR